VDKSIFRAYDVRGIYPSELNEEDAYKIARAICEYVHPKKAAVGRDARLAAPSIQRAVCLGLQDGGCGVTDCGMTGTDMVGWAAGALDFDVTINVTASHNPKEWIGMKIFSRGGASIGGSGEIEELGTIVEQRGANWMMPTGGQVSSKLDLTQQWVKHVLSFAKVDNLPRLKIVVDAGNGVAGPTVRELFQRLPVELVEMYFEPDGNFLNHLPSPIEPKNVEDLCKRVVEEKADLGMAFDGDADRVFLVDNNGRWVTGSEMTAMVMDEILTQDPKRTVLYNAICGWNVRDVVEKHQAHALRTKVGHGFIKKDMRAFDAYFAGEHSGHYFFKENFSCDSGVIAAMFVLSLMAKEGKKLSEVLEPYRKYFQIPETNFAVTDPKAVVNELAKKFAHEEIGRLDGLTIETLDWWANIRPSANEPLLRLNIEAKSPELLEQVRQELTDVISANG